MLFFFKVFKMDLEKKQVLRSRLKEDPDLANELIQYIEYLEHQRNFLQSQIDLLKDQIEQQNIKH